MWRKKPMTNAEVFTRLCDWFLRHRVDGDQALMVCTMVQAQVVGKSITGAENPEEEVDRMCSQADKTLRRAMAIFLRRVRPN